MEKEQKLKLKQMIQPTNQTYKIALMQTSTTESTQSLSNMVFTNTRDT